MTTLLDGRMLSEKILTELKDEVKKLNKKIELGIVLVGDDAVSEKYIEKKIKAGKEIGIEVKVYRYDKEITTKKLRREIGRICKISSIKGILVQLPLPEHINTQSILNAVVVEKDVDVLSAKALGRFYVEKSPIMPVTVAGIIMLLEEYNIELKGKTVAVVGQGKLVGKPMTIALMQREATVISINEFTENKEDLIKKADIIISGVGKPGLITKDMIKPSAIVVDAGTAASYQGTGNRKMQIIGDAAEDVKEVASYITPVPGGVGPMTVAMIFWNLIKLSE